MASPSGRWINTWIGSTIVGRLLSLLLVKVAAKMAVKSKHFGSDDPRPPLIFVLAITLAEGITEQDLDVEQHNLKKGRNPTAHLSYVAVMLKLLGFVRSQLSAHVWKYQRIILSASKISTVSLGFLWVMNECMMCHPVTDAQRGKFVPASVRPRATVTNL